MISGPPDDVRLGMIFEKFVPAVLAKQGMKAAGVKGSEKADPKAAKLFLDEWKEFKQRVSRIGEKREPAREISPFIPQERETVIEDVEDEDTPTH